MKKQIQQLGYSHDAMIDAMILNPRITNKELSEQFGYGPQWVSTVKWSDAFQKRLKERQEELINPEIRMSIEERIKGIVGRSLEVLEAKLQGDVNDIPDSVVLKALELGAKGLGIGGYSSGPQLQVNIPQADHLSRLAENLLLLQKKSKEAQESSTLDGEVTDITPKE